MQKRPSQPNERLRQARMLRGWSQRRLASEIGTGEDRVCRWEAGARPGKYFQEKLCELFGKNTVELGFIEGTRNSGDPPNQDHVTIHSSDHSSYPTITSEDPNGVPVARRDFLCEMGHMILGLISAEVLDHFYRALKKPSTIDEATLQWLSKRSEGYWQDRNDAIISSHNLIRYVLDDFSKVTTLLESSLSPSVRASLCSTAGELAMLVGELYFDLKSYAQSRRFYAAAINAAHEADNFPLQAVAFGRMSFSWSYDSNLQEALICVSNGRHIAKNAHITIQSWLAAVETEVQAKLNDKEAFFKALKGVQYSESYTSQKRENYWIHFNQSLAAGYKGVSFLKLAQKARNAQGRTFSMNAQDALAEAIEMLDPALTRRKPTLLVDLAGTYIQISDIEQACGIAMEAATLTNQIKSQVVLQRILDLRKELEPWRSTEHVSTLDSYISSILTSDWYIRGCM